MAHSSALTRRKKSDDRHCERTALITAPVATDTTLIRRILSSEEVKSFALDELGVPGESLQAIVEEAIDQVDMVMVVLPGSNGRDNVLMELGFALACKKPILILADDKVPLPELASNIPYLRGALDNEKALRFGLTQFLKAPRLQVDSDRTVILGTARIGMIVSRLALP